MSELAKQEFMQSIEDGVTVLNPRADGGILLVYVIEGRELGFSSNIVDANLPYILRRTADSIDEKNRLMGKRN